MLLLGREFLLCGDALPLVIVSQSREAKETTAGAPHPHTGTCTDTTQIITRPSDQESPYQYHAKTTGITD